VFSLRDGKIRYLLLRAKHLCIVRVIRVMIVEVRRHNVMYYAAG